MSDENLIYAEVALPLPLEKTFHYSVPQALRECVLPGARVQVPFGKKTMTGYVTALVLETGVPGVKDILAVLDAEPAITEELSRSPAG
jgi:Primosomal protein N'' (replication factor Y) - superfamily II helicase